MNVGDMVVKDGKAWKVSGIYLSGVNGQDVIGLTNMNPLVSLGDGEMMVPIELVRDFLFSPST